MRIYDHENIPRVWRDYLNGHQMPVSDGMALIVADRTNDPELILLDRWLQERDIKSSKPATSFALLVMIPNDAAALLKLCMPL